MALSLEAIAAKEHSLKRTSPPLSANAILCEKNDWQKRERESLTKQKALEKAAHLSATGKREAPVSRSTERSRKNRTEKNRTEIDSNGLNYALSLSLSIWPLCLAIAFGQLSDGRPFANANGLKRKWAHSLSLSIALYRAKKKRARSFSIRSTNKPTTKERLSS